MMIQYINQYPENEEFDYAKRLRLLRERKLAQTAEKVKKEGGLNEDDYGRVVAPDYLILLGFSWYAKYAQSSLPSFP